MKTLNLNFLRMPNLIKGILIVFLAVTVIACEEENPVEPENPITKDIMEIVDETANVSTLKAAIDAAGLRSTLEGDGPFTVFAPTDDAFAALEMANPGIIDYLLENTEELTKVLTYHVVAGEVQSTDLENGPVPTLNGQTVEIDLSNGVMVNDASVTTADVLATNGVIHLINKVLIPDDLVLPEPAPEQAIMEIVDATSSVATLKAAIDAASLRATLDGEGPFTVFAPSDAAFDAFSTANPGVLEFLLANPEELAKVLTYHVVSGKVFSTDLSNGNVATVNGEEVTVDLSSGVKINNATVTGADIEATNGVIHLIDMVLVPSNITIPANLNPDGTQKKIMEVVDGTETVSTLKAAIDAASLRETLDGEGPFTVFAPTDDAFTAFSTENPGVLEFLLANPDELAKVLTYHVVSGEVFSTDLSNGDVATVNGGSVTVDLTNGVMINDANVTGADVDVANGVIHIIDKVLVPADVNIPANLNPDGTEMTIADLAIATENLSTLVEILSLAGLSDILAAADDPSATLTVFAPTNDAFAAVLSALGLTSIDEIPESVLLDIVKYHIVGSVAKSTDLTSTTYATLNGESVTVDLSSGVMVDNANVTTADVMGSNGVVHIVDAVLLPSLYTSALGTIVEVPLFRKDFSILTSALVKAELVETLLTDNMGNKFTVFAPNNDAFGAAGLDQAAIDGLSKEDLTPILLYHVLGSEVLSTGLPATSAAMPSAITTLGGDFYLSNRGNDAGVFINGAVEVTGVDITKSNGVIHTISQTLLPADMTIAAKATGLGFTRLVDALVEAGLDGVFAGAGDFTVFAPTNDAFDALYNTLSISGPDQVDGALGAGTLDAVLKYHVLGARVFSSDLEDGLSATTLQTGNFTVNVSANGVSITDADPDFADANVVATDVTATNGVIHAIDAVLLPVDL